MITSGKSRPRQNGRELGTLEKVSINVPKKGSGSSQRKFTLKDQTPGNAFHRSGPTAMTPLSTTHRAAGSIAIALALAAGSAFAALSDEIQVYTDDINQPREFGLELHVNTTPSGRVTRDYPGEVVPAHGWRITPEFSYGLTSEWEAGLYVPTSRDNDGSFSVAGAKLRLKWLPVKPADKQLGWFAGANGELSRLAQKFSESRDSAELRLMAGYRGASWLLAINPVFGWNLSSGYRARTPDFGLSFKASHEIAEGIAVGLEHYSELGTTRRLLPANEQGHTLYLALDVETKALAVNFGVGRGLNSVTDKWTVKAIFGFQF